MVTGSRVNEQQLAELMAAYQQGDIRAFDGLYWSLRPRLQQYLSILTRSRSLAEDLLQETFLQIHRSRATYWPGRPVVPWALAIARHVYLMDLRKRIRVEAREITVDDPPELPVPPEVERLAERAHLQHALNQLPRDQREAVVLHCVWGFTFAEIGLILEVRAITAKVRAFRGLRAVRTILGADV